MIIKQPYILDEVVLASQQTNHFMTSHFNYLTWIILVIWGLFSCHHLLTLMSLQTHFSLSLEKSITKKIFSVNVLFLPWNCVHPKLYNK